MRKSWIVGPTLTVLLAAGASTGCSDSAKNADPKPVNVKEDPRIKRAVVGSENSTGGQLPSGK